MTNDAYLIRAPQGGIAWTMAEAGCTRASRPPRRWRTTKSWLIVSDDGYVRGVTPLDLAPLVSGERRPR